MERSLLQFCASFQIGLRLAVVSEAILSRVNDVVLSFLPVKSMSVKRLRAHGSNCNLVDPASSHMLVSKIKPCMSKYMFLTAKL